MTPLALAMVALPAAAQLSVASNADVIDKVKLKAVDTDKASQGPIKKLASKRYIVELTGKSVAAYGGNIKGLAAAQRTAKGTLNFSSASTKAYQSHLASEHSQTQTAFKAAFPNGQVKRSYSVVFNGMAVQGSHLNKAALASLPNVKAVYEDKLIQVKDAQSLATINASSAWSTLGAGTTGATAGSGIRVAVIDSGIRNDNAMFDDSGFTAPSDLPDDDYCHTTDSSFCNNKLIVARLYDAPDGTSSSEYTTSPTDYVGHGTHVAGIAVGDPVTATYQGSSYSISGVAPGAYLMVYKALFYDGSTASGDTSTLISAMEDAVSDGADVINNSWGGSAGVDPAESPFQQIYTNVEDAGVVIATAAGNDGNSSNTIDCPACIEAGIAVANSQDGQEFVNTVTVDGTSYEAVEGTSSVSLADLDSSDLTAPLLSAAVEDASNADGCDAFPSGTFTDSYALIERGTCTFTTKADNAEAAGALGIVVYDNESESLFTMAMDDASIPGVLISQSDGETIEALLAAGSEDVTLSADISQYIDDSLVDVMSSSSSRGPNGDASILKPDLAAPGTNILSATSPDSYDSDYTVMSGTSMATPHVAGAAALILAAHSDWTPQEVKAALTTTASTDVLDDDASTAATPFAMGAGRIDVGKAINAALSVSPVSLASGSCESSCSFSVDTTNLLDSSVTWVGTISFTSSAVTGTVTADSDVQGDDSNDMVLAADGTGSFTVAVDTSAASSDTWYFGTVTWTDSAGSEETAHMPVAVYVGDLDTSSTASASLTTTAGTVTAGNSLAASTVLTNGTVDDTLTVTTTIPSGVTVAGTPTATVSGGSQSSFSYDSSSQEMTWTGTLDAGATSLSSGPSWLSSLTSLTDGYSPYTISCSTACDDGEATIDVSAFGFTYMGTSVSTLTLGTNGYITVNDASVTNSATNDDLPSSRVSGGMLAPFWADLDLSGTGGWYYQEITDGTNSYLVIEWYDATLYGDTSGNSYSFQVIFELNSDNVYFHYLTLSDLPDDLTVGLQNNAGNVGDALYYDGSGTEPAAGDAYTVSYTSPGSVTLGYNISALPSAGDVTASTTEGSAVTVDLLSQLDSATYTIAATASGGDLDASSNAVFESDPDGDAADDGITITSEPASGTVTVADDGTTTYTPDRGFSGTDSFSYTLTDSAGNVSTAGTATITVTAATSSSSTSQSGGGGGGAFGWLPLLLLSLVGYRRRRR